MTINVKHERRTIPISRDVFDLLFANSVVADRAGVRNALRDKEIGFHTLIDLSRTAEIPYPLFFAPLDVVTEQLRIKTAKLMAGFSKKHEFCVHSRNPVHLADVELIVKDLLRKQDLVRTDQNLQKNPIIGLLKTPGASIAADAAKLTTALQLDPAYVRGAKDKTKALARLIETLEANHILVAQSVKKYMPQTIPKGARFSGMTIKDNKVPYIFLASGDEGEKMEPTGRRIFTLTLLTVLIARKRFATVTYSGHTDQEVVPREYDIAAEILMPSADLQRTTLNNLDDIYDASNEFKVTPSAIVMRARRLGLLTREDAHTYLSDLQDAYADAENHPYNQPGTITALRKYNGDECSRRVLALLDNGAISHGDFCRIMFSNKLRTKQQVNDYRAAIG